MAAARGEDALSDPDAPGEARPATPGGPAAAPRRRLGEDVRRAQIIRATILVVAEGGFDGASANAIAARAGVSKGLLWRYFADKHDLMRQAVIGTVEALRDAIAAELDLTAPVPDVIRAAIRRAAALSGTHREELRAVNQIIHSLRTADGSPAFDLGDYEGTYLAQETLFRRGQEEGSLRPFDTRVMAVTYQGAIDAMLAYVDSHPQVDVGAYADALADVLLAGMAR
ncbi:TetR/AcrR family transcriptional regulator [Patulibacter sp. NPDC049589]|uniref:TetR/AcrR family transcriptional regulator n=1 Tax=Patulibacter sp. NPDC049589 TaxID=3154731 RepID=UPI00342D25F1